jgi:hypothetical protein
MKTEILTKKEKEKTLKSRLIEIKTEHTDAVHNFMAECQVFWAFSNDRFDEHMKELSIDDESLVVSIGDGGFMPLKNKDKYLSGLRCMRNEYSQKIKNENLKEQNILYELNNHEAFYNDTITDTLEALGDDYTESEVMAVFTEKKKKFNY